jgi:hypothetical protein
VAKKRTYANFFKLKPKKIKKDRPYAARGNGEIVQYRRQNLPSIQEIMAFLDEKKD